MLAIAYCKRPTVVVPRLVLYEVPRHVVHIQSQRGWVLVRVPAPSVTGCAVPVPAHGQHSTYYMCLSLSVGGEWRGGKRA